MLLGLSLTVNIEQDEYIPEISGSAGLRLLIHNQYNMPFVEDEGLALSTGQSSVVGIKKVCLLIPASANALNNVI